MKQRLLNYLLLLALIVVGSGNRAWADGNKRILDSQNYENATASDWTSPNGTVSLKTGDATYGNYSQVDVSGNGNRSCYKSVTFGYDLDGYTTADLSTKGYVIEFDMRMAGGRQKDRSEAQFIVPTTGPNLKNNATYSGSDYIFALSQPQNTTGALETTWYINDLTNTSNSITLNDEWYHYKLVVSETSVAYTISKGTETTKTGSLTVSSLPTITGFFGLTGRTYGRIAFDNLEIYDYTSNLTVSAPTFTFEKVDGANRIYTLTNTEGSGKIYYTTAPADEAPAIFSNAYSTTTDLTKQVAYSESGKYYAYVLHTDGITASAVTEQVVTAGALTLAEPVFTVTDMVQAADGYYYPQITFASDNSMLEGAPTATFDQTSPYTFTGTGSFTVTASAEGYTSSSSTFTVTNKYKLKKTIDFGALTASDFDATVWETATGAPRDYWTNRAAAIPADVTYYKLKNPSSTAGSPDNSAVLDGITISNYYQRVPEVYLGYGLLTPYTQVSGNSNNMNFTVNGGTAEDYIVYNGWNNYGSGTFNTVLAGNSTFALYRYDTMLRTIKVYSQPATYEITATANPAEGGNVTGAGTYEEGAQVTLTATANNGYNFVNWTDATGEVSTEATYNFTATADVALTANFDAVPTVVTGEVTMAYSGTTTANMTGNNDATTLGLDNTAWSVIGAKGSNSYYPGLNKAGDFRIYKGNTITVESLTGATINNIAITFTDASYSNVSVTVNGNAVNGTNGTYDIGASKFVLGNANTTTTQVRIKSIVINYETGGSTQLNTYTITATANPAEGGSVTGAGTYEEGAQVTLIATANSGYNFVNWTDATGEVSTEATYNFTATANAALTANFTAEPTVVADGVTMAYSGTTTTNMTGNNDAALLGLDDTDWSVIGAKGSNSNYPGLNKAGDFRLYNGNTITVESLTGATINNIAITFTDANYSNISVTVNGNAVNGTNGTYDIGASKFVLGNANTTTAQVRIKSIVINYETGGSTQLNTYTITATANPAEGGSVTGAGTYEEGAQVTLIATANSGYNFVNWTDATGEVSTEATYNFTATANAALTANFTAEPTVVADGVTMAYSGTTTTNMTGNNDAALLGLDDTDWSVIGAKGSNSNYPGLNKAGDFRLYNGNTITVESLTGATINNITITFTDANYSNVSVTVDGNTVSGTNGTYTIGASQFVLGNANTTTAQVRIKSIVINYAKGSSTEGQLTPADGDSFAQGEQNSDVEGVMMTFGGQDEEPQYTFVTAEPAVNGFATVTEGIGQAPVDDEGNAYDAKKQNLPTKGTFYVFEPTKDGQLDVTVDLEKNKKLFVTEDGEALKNFNGITAVEGNKLSFAVKATKTYYLFANDTNLKFYGFSFTPADGDAENKAKDIATFKLLKQDNADGDTLLLKDAMVTYIKGDNVFVEDESGATVFYKTGIQFYKDQKLNGFIVGQNHEDKNMPQLLRTDKTNYKSFKAVKDSAASKTITVAEAQLKENIARFVKLTDVVSTKDKRGFRILTDSLDNTIRIEDHFNVFYELPDTLESIEGIIGIDAEGTFYLWPTSKEGVVKKVVEPETPDNPDNPDNPDQPEEPEPQVFFAEAYSSTSTVDGWSTSVGGRFDPAILNEDENYYLSVNQETRNNNGAVVTGTILNDKVPADKDFTLTFDMKLSSSTNQTATELQIKDAANANNVLSLKETGTWATTWSLNGTETTISLPNSNKGAGSNTIADVTWNSYKISSANGKIYLTITDKGTGETIFERQAIESSATGGLGNIVFVTSRYNANFAIDNIKVCELAKGDVPDEPEQPAMETGTETEMDAAGGAASNESVEGKSYVIDGTYIAGKGSAIATGMTSKGFKLRTGLNEGTAEITVKNTYTITDLTINGVSNYDANDATAPCIKVTKVEIDGEETAFTGGEFPAKGASDCGTLTLSGIAAKSSIKLYFDNANTKGTQLTVAYAISYETPAATAPRSVAITPDVASLLPGETLQLSGKMDPETFEGVWSSSDKSVATVDENGLVTAVGGGTATITYAWTKDASYAATATITVSNFDTSKLMVVKEYDFTQMGNVTLTIQSEVLGKIWNAANKQTNDVFNCTNEGLEELAVQAVLKSNKGWSIVDGKGLYEGSGAGRCAAIGGLKAGQYVEFQYTGNLFETRSKADGDLKNGADIGATKTAIKEGAGRNIYQVEEDGVVGFELAKGNYVEKILIYDVLPPVAGATLAHTASSSCGSDANTYTSTVDVEKEHVNNNKFSGTWQGAAYAEFTFTIPEGETLTNATLTFAGYGESRRARNTDVMVVNAGEKLDYAALSTGNAKVNLAATTIQSVDFPQATTATPFGIFDIDVTSALEVIHAAGQNYIIFKFTNNPGGGDLGGKASENAPVLTITTVGQPVIEEDPELVAPAGWTTMISNGNLATDVTDNYYAKEAPASDPSLAVVTPGAGKNGSRGILVKAQNMVSQAWDTQFWIKTNETLPAGTKVHVEFDYKADKAAKASTQSHGAPSTYMHWACIGDVNFTEEWQHFATDFEVASEADGMQSIAFNLNEFAKANNYYFDNFGVWVQKPKPIDSWIDIAVNGTLDQENIANKCFYVTEQGVGGPYLAEPVKGLGKDGGYAIKVQSADNAATDWSTQFFIRLPYQLPAGTKYRVSFDYKADKAGDFETQAHAEPSDYIHNACIGTGSFSTEWQTYEKTGTISGDMSKSDKPMQTIAFNLAKNKTATEFVFDNIKIEVPSDVLATLTQNPSLKPVLDPTLIEVAQDQGKSLDTFERTGFEEGENFNTYTATGDLQVAFKMYDIDVADCDYVVVKFAEPVKAGWCVAFWAQGGTDNVGVAEGATEYKYVFADDQKCAVQNDVLPQICMLTLWGAQKPLVANIRGIYKHQIPTIVDKVDGIANNVIDTDAIYNLRGQKVTGTLKPGLYIKNGKKVVIK